MQDLGDRENPEKKKGRVTRRRKDSDEAKQTVQSKDNKATGRN